MSSSQRPQLNSTLLTLPQLISTQLKSLNTTHSSQLNSIQLKSAHPNSAYLTWFKLNSIQLKSADLNAHNSTQLTQHDSLISTELHSAQISSSQLTQLNSQLNWLNAIHSSQLDSIELKSAHLNSHNSNQLYSLTLPHLISTQLN